ncbi:Chromatin-remodeling complexes subunit NGG1 [Lachnellula cervina]|uniref:Chromatin-remodeling complexes subunit NGG1 n=1 Tax=Lachnellula cervina TaxID=1316786 RepID=A0A7D8UTN6_9HELO|nr:Chromatin-remodeling complexes subunit NGG1 [Lachnellula cervina]
MPPLPSQKGTGKKGRDPRQSRSRNTTPNIIPHTESGETGLLELPKDKFPTSPDFGDYVALAIPSSKDLEALSDKLKRLMAIIETRGDICNKGMRLMVEMRKDRQDDIARQNQEQEVVEKKKRDAAEEEERGRHRASKLKRKKDISTGAEERPLTHGAHAYTEEDSAFLRDRGDRTTPFVMPRRGKKHYSELWAEEDGAMALDNPLHDRDKLPANQGRGSIDTLDDAIAETDQISAGPVVSRLLATLRPEHRAPPSEEKPTANGLTNGEANINGEANGDLADSVQASGETAPVPPATYMTDSASESWKKASHPKLEYSQVDERLKQELRHIGFLPPDPDPDYEAHYDDELAVRLRALQAELKQQSIINGARKSKLQDVVKERMAHQEYTTILEDLDSQVQTAYLKRTRTMGKSKKNKRPGGAGGGSHFVGSSTGMARPGIGDMTKTVMERRKKWIEGIGLVFDDERSTVKVPRSSNPGSSIFKPDDMGELIKREKESWDEDAEEE